MKIKNYKKVLIANKIRVNHDTLLGDPFFQFWIRFRWRYDHFTDKLQFLWSYFDQIESINSKKYVLLESNCSEDCGIYIVDKISWIEWHEFKKTEFAGLLLNNFTFKIVQAVVRYVYWDSVRATMLVLDFTVIAIVNSCGVWIHVYSVSKSKF